MITQLGHVAFRVRDLDRSLDFYCRRLGLREAFRLHRKDGSLWIVYLYLGNGSFLELFPGGESAGNSGSYQHLCLHVGDMEKTLRKLREAGYPIEGSVRMGEDGNWQYWLEDPDGNRIELMQILPDSLQAQAQRRFAEENGQ